MTGRIFQDFMEQFASGLAGAFANPLKEEEKITRPNPTQSSLPSNAATKTSTAKAPESLFTNQRLSSVVDQALAEDGVITLKGDAASVGKKGKRGSFSKMPSRSSGSINDMDLFSLSRSLAEGDDVDPETLTRTLDALTKNITDPAERQRLRVAQTASLGESSGQSRVKKREGALQAEQVKALQRADKQAEFQEAQTLSTPEDMISAFVNMREGKPSMLGDSEEPVVDVSSTPDILDVFQGAPMVGEAANLLRSFYPKTTISNRGERIAQTLRKITNQPVDTPEDLVRLILAVQQAESRSNKS